MTKKDKKVEQHDCSFNIWRW